MGRGRQKAKQTKVARDLKYRPVSTDFASLERELRGGGSSYFDEHVDEVEQTDDDELDPYADLAGKYADDDDDDEYAERRSS